MHYELGCIWSTGVFKWRIISCTY